MLTFVEADILACSVLEGKVTLDAGKAGETEIPEGQRVYFTEAKGLRPVEALPQGESEGLNTGFAFSGPDPLAPPFDLSTAVLGLAPHWARLWFAMSPAEQAEVQRILEGIPELRNLAGELGIEY